MRLRRVAAASLVLALLAVPAAADSAPVVDTFAGGGVGDGRPPLQTHLTSLLAVDVDARGNIFWTENRHAVGGNRARMYDADAGVVRTIAGNGMDRGLLNDLRESGPASEAVLFDAAGIAGDGRGSVYVYDSKNWRLRRVDLAQQTVETVHVPDFLHWSVGTPVDVDAQGRVYFPDNYRLVRYDPATGAVDCLAGCGPYPLDVDGQPAWDVRIGAIEDLDVDDEGNIYLVEQGVFFGGGSSLSNGPRLRWIDTDGIIHTLAGGKQARLTEDGHWGLLTQLDKRYRHLVLAQDDGSVLYTDGDRVRRVSATQELPHLPGSRRVTTVLRVTGGDADGPLDDAEIGSIADWDHHPSGGIVIADAANLRIRLIDDDAVTTLVGNGLPATDGPGHDIFDWTGDGLHARDAFLSLPCGVAVDELGDVLVSETTLTSKVLGKVGFHSRIRRVDAATGSISTIAGGDEPGYSGDGGPAGEARLQNPCGMVLAADGDLYVADSGNHVVRRIDAATGVITTVAGTGQAGSDGDGGPATAASLHNPVAVALDGGGNLYVSEHGGHRIRRIDAGTGTITTVAGTGEAGFGGDGNAATSAQLNAPFGVAVLPDGALVFTDAANHRVRKVTTGGIIVTVAGTGSGDFSGDGGPATRAALRFPTGLVVDPSDGALWIADSGNQRVRRVRHDGAIETVAGRGVLDLCGDGGPPSGACFRNPRGLALTPSGDLLIAELTNLRVRVVRR